MTNKLYFIVTLLGVIFSANDGVALQCLPFEQVTFEKQIGVRPSNTSFLLSSVFTYRLGDTPSTDWITIECVKKCLSLPECHSALVIHQEMECIGLPYSDSQHLTLENDASYFVKTCMRIPESCRSKLWTVEMSPGYHLISREAEVATFEDVTAEECSRQLTQPRQDNIVIKSTQFLLPNKNDGYISDGNDIEYTPSAKGRCTLSTENKFTQPESYRVANNDVFYKENQCVEDFPKEIDRCSYEEYYNQTLKHYDAIIHGITTPECKRRCENEQEFNCRGFTAISYENRPYYHISIDSDESDVKICLLHSEDTLSLGSWLLTKRSDAIYYRRVVCLNVIVECTPNAMTVTYWPKSDFHGRLYVSGYSETCSTAGQGRDQPTQLVVPFHSDACGVNQAYALIDENEIGRNRTLMYTMLVIQNNPIIQAQGDRFVRVGCVAAPSFNLTLGTDINVENGSDGSFGVEGYSPSFIPASSIINTTSATNIPKAKMYIINEPDINEQMGQITGGAVALGETIELRIEAEQTGSEIVDIHAYHLVASSQLGDSSVLLLDGRGCPTGQVDFPALRRTQSNGIIRLASRFKAFRFPNSHVVKFSVMVQFCVGSCGPIYCDAQSTPLSRQLRSVIEPNTKTKNETTAKEERVKNETMNDFSYENASVSFIDPSFMKEKSMRNAHVVVASSETGSRVREMCKEMNESHESRIPLELSLIVASNDVFTADSLIYGENHKILVAGVGEPEKESSSMICVHEAFFIALTFIWLIVQILILAGCMVVIKRYRSFAEDNKYHKDYHSFDNLGFDSMMASRRVHWPDQNVDILHAT